MKKILYIVLILSAGIFFNSCEDLLERTPLDKISDPDFWTTETDLKLYVNSLYEYFEGYAGVGTGNASTKDCGTDIVLETTSAHWATHTLRMDGSLSVPASGGGWSWNKIHQVNSFLENSSRVPKGGRVDHYIGEGYFFRAYFYFDLLSKFGDLPIYYNTISADDEENLYASRSSRTDVANFIIADLDSAISKMNFANETGPSRLNKDIATLFKARVCLYEGTWEKYHMGTVFAGNTDGSEYLQKAADAAKAVMDTGNYSIVTGDTSNVYYNLFNQTDYAGHSEIMFYKHYDWYAYGNEFGNHLSTNMPNGYGLTHEFLQMYLCTDGDPYAASPLYQGDSLHEIEINRDPRCAQTVMVPGDITAIKINDTTFFKVPKIKACPTGYETEKFRQTVFDIETGKGSRDVGYIFFRYAEALLIYAEAKGELGDLTQNDLDISINQLRDRVGMPHMTLGAITVDPNWPDYGVTLPDYLYEIRRERTLELYGEGNRFDDLMRWRAHSLWYGKRFTGTYYTEDIKRVDKNQPSNDDGYLDPFQLTLNGPNGGYGFDKERDYLLPLPIIELSLNDKLDQNPGWGE